MGGEEAVAAVVHMGRLRGDAVNFQHPDALATPQRLRVPHAHVVATEVEAVVGGADRIHRPYECRRVEMVRVQEDRAARVRAHLGQFDDLACRRCPPRGVGMLPSVDAGQGDGSRVGEDQALESALAVADDRWPPFVGDREDVSVVPARVAGPEHPVLLARDVLLGQRGSGRRFEERFCVGLGVRDNDSVSASASIGLQDDGVVQAFVLQERT